jgi:hypothetical protein
VTGYDQTNRTGGLRVARSRGALSGLLLVLLGLWGALVPFIGPYADYAYTPDSAWTWTAGRFWLEVLPGAAAALGGLLLLVTANRAVALFGAWLAAAAGAWFVVGPVLGRLWGGPEGSAGSPVGGATAQVVEQIGFFSGLGAVILLLGAHAAGRLGVVSQRDIRATRRHEHAGAGSDGTPAADRAYQPDEATDRTDAVERADGEGQADGAGRAGVRTDDDGATDGATTATNPRRR